MRPWRFIILPLTVIACGGDPTGPGDASVSGADGFAWQIVHRDFAGLCMGPQCTRRSLIAGGEFVADDAEDWVATLSPEEHDRMQALATSSALAAFMRRDVGPEECPGPTDYGASLELRTVKVRDGRHVFESLRTDDFGCFLNPAHPAGAAVAEILALREKHRPMVMPGRARICVATNGPWPAGNPHDVSFSGSVLGVVESFDHAPQPLEGVVIQRGNCDIWSDVWGPTLSLRAGEQRWLVTLGAMTGLPRTARAFPELPSWTGKSVQMTIHRGANQDSAEGIVITENGQLLFAMQNSQLFKPLAATYLAGLTVSVGPMVLTDRSRCSPRVHSALSFAGSTAVDVAPGQEGQFTIGGLPYSARTIASHALEGGPCMDKPPRDTAWIAWRR